MATNEQIVDALAPLAQQYGYDAAQFVPRALETLDGLDPSPGEYTIIDNSTDSEIAHTPLPLDGLSVNELRSMAKEIGVDTDGTKAELHARIKDWAAIPDSIAE